MEVWEVLGNLRGLSNGGNFPEALELYKEVVGPFTGNSKDQETWKKVALDKFNLEASKLLPVALKNFFDVRCADEEKKYEDERNEVLMNRMEKEFDLEKEVSSKENILHKAYRKNKDKYDWLEPLRNYRDNLLHLEKYAERKIREYRDEAERGEKEISRILNAKKLGVVQSVKNLNAQGNHYPVNLVERLVGVCRERGYDMSVPEAGTEFTTALDVYERQN